MSKAVEAWSGDFGVEYTNRNMMPTDELDKIYKVRFGISRSEMNERFISNLDRDIKILEVGCNVGLQLTMLQNMGFKNLYGIELLPYAVEAAKNQTKGINIIQGSAYDVPFKDNYFDLVFTSGLLIHIPPVNINLVINEMARCTKRYIWAYEYYAPEYTAINYRGHNDLLWKADFAEMFKSLKFRLVKEQRFKYLDKDNLDTMFLMEKSKC